VGNKPQVVVNFVSLSIGLVGLYKAIGWLVIQKAL
jgi:hypothetical protein